MEEDSRLTVLQLLRHHKYAAPVDPGDIYPDRLQDHGGLNLVDGSGNALFSFGDYGSLLTDEAGNHITDEAGNVLALV
jgi:hypothetical protein